MIDVVTGNIGIMQSLITRMGILSLPCALLLGIEDIILSTTADSTFLNEKCSDNGYCLGAKRSRLHSNPKSFVRPVSNVEFCMHRMQFKQCIMRKPI